MALPNRINSIAYDLLLLQPKTYFYSPIDLYFSLPVLSFLSDAYIITISIAFVCLSVHLFAKAFL